VTRLSGAGRVETAIEIARAAFPDGADTVVLARADAYADALAGAPLAASLDAPVLLTGSDALHPAVAAFIADELGADDAVLLGGQAALSAQVDTDTAAAGLDTTRVSGPNRFATAAAVAAQLGDTDEVFIAEGEHTDPARGWPDALSAAGLAAPLETPILLVNANRLPAETADRLDDDTDVTIVGGTVAVSAAVAAAIDDAAGDVTRLSGATRYATSARVADEALDRGQTAAVVWLATGRNWPDALAAGPAVAATGGVLLLIDGTNGLAGSPETRQWLTDHAEDLTAVRITGGTQAITPTVVDDVTALLDD